MNETASDKKPAAPQPKSGDGLTRIRIKHLYFHDAFDLAYGSSSSQISNVSGGPQAENRAYYDLEFIPAWQHIEIVACSADGAFVSSQMVPIHQVKRWVRA